MDNEFKRLKKEEDEYFKNKRNTFVASQRNNDFQRKKNDVAEFDYHLLDSKPIASASDQKSQTSQSVLDQKKSEAREKLKQEMYSQFTGLVDRGEMNSPYSGIDTTRNVSGKRNIGGGSFEHSELYALAQEEIKRNRSKESMLAFALSTPDSTLPLSGVTQITNDLRRSPAQVAYEKSLASQYEKQKKNQEQQVNNWANEHPILASAASLASSPFSGIDYLNQFVQYQAIGETLPSGNLFPGELTQTLRTGASENMSDTGKLLYQLGTSTADGLIADKLSGGNPLIGGLILAGAAASATANDVRARGGTDEQALARGAETGLMEALGESLSLGNLKALKTLPVSDLKTFLKNIEKSMLVNFSDGTLASAANALFDFLHMKELSNYALLVDEYKASGMSERDAKKAAGEDIIQQILADGTTDGMIGAGMSTAVQGVNLVNSGAFDIDAIDAFVDNFIKDWTSGKIKSSTGANIPATNWNPMMNVANPLLPQMRPAFAMDGYNGWQDTEVNGPYLQPWLTKDSYQFAENEGRSFAKSENDFDSPMNSLENFEEPVYDGSDLVKEHLGEVPEYKTEEDTHEDNANKILRQNRRDEAKERYGLSYEESKAIVEYVGGDAYAWTSIQRGEDRYERTEYSDYWIEQLTNGLRKMPTFEGRTYRNLVFNEKKDYNAFLREYALGEKVRLKAFSSASKVPNGYVAKDGFMVHLVIDGVSARDISESYSVPSQQEVIFMPGTNLRIEFIGSANDGNLLIYAKEVSQYG
ncbi:MAG: hypothetical protein IKC03_10610 [Oscillospiraceae bacterium]|nr:hypothetical protein [Oscillospiraceae bacterium]